MRWTKKISKYYELEKAAYNERKAKLKEIKKKNKKKEVKDVSTSV